MKNVSDPSDGQTAAMPNHSNLNKKNSHGQTLANALYLKQINATIFTNLNVMHYFFCFSAKSVLIALAETRHFIATSLQPC